MPGVVKSIACEVGDSVEEGTTIVVLEAMKMQNPLFAPMSGKVSTVFSRLAPFMLYYLWYHYYYYIPSSNLLP